MSKEEKRVVHSRKEAIMTIEGKGAKVVELDYATGGEDFVELTIKGKLAGVSVVWLGQSRNDDRIKLDAAKQAAEKAVKALQELAGADNPLLAQFGIDLTAPAVQVEEKLELLQTLMD